MEKKRKFVLIQTHREDMDWDGAGTQHISTHNTIDEIQTIVDEAKVSYGSQQYRFSYVILQGIQIYL